MDSIPVKMMKENEDILRLKIVIEILTHLWLSEHSPTIKNWRTLLIFLRHWIGLSKTTIARSVFYDGCFKSHIAAIKHFFIFVRRSGTSLASKCKHGSSLDISFLSVTQIL